MPYHIDSSGRDSWRSRSYLWALLENLIVVFKQTFSRTHRAMRRRAEEERSANYVLPPGYRAEHRLMVNEKDHPRCFVCKACEEVCPSKCIQIDGERGEENGKGARLDSFSIDLGRCAFCGLCVTACPVDALRMDTGRVPVPRTKREELIYDKEKLLNNQAEGQSRLSRCL